MQPVSRPASGEGCLDPPSAPGPLPKPRDLGLSTVRQLHLQNKPSGSHRVEGKASGVPEVPGCKSSCSFVQVSNTGQVPPPGLQRYFRYSFPVFSVHEFCNSRSGGNTAGQGDTAIWTSVSATELRKHAAALAHCMHTASTAEACSSGRETQQRLRPSCSHAKVTTGEESSVMPQKGRDCYTQQDTTRAEGYQQQRCVRARTSAGIPTFDPLLRRDLETQAEETTEVYTAVFRPVSPHHVEHAYPTPDNAHKTTPEK